MGMVIRPTEKNTVNTRLKDSFEKKKQCKRKEQIPRDWTKCRKCLEYETTEEIENEIQYQRTGYDN